MTKKATLTFNNTGLSFSNQPVAQTQPYAEVKIVVFYLWLPM